MVEDHSLKIIVLGYVVRCPLAGMALHHLQYVKGFRDLGFEVRFVEDSGDEKWACYDPNLGMCGPDPSYGLSWTQSAFECLGLEQNWAYHNALEDRWMGPGAGSIVDYCSGADLLVNLSGSNMLRDPWGSVPIRVYVDTDPGFTQLRNQVDEERHRRTVAHTDFFSYGENIEKQCALVEEDGFQWLATRQPIDLQFWESGVARDQDTRAFRTVMQWDNGVQDSDRVAKSRRLGLKAESFSPFFDLPKRSGFELELAVGQGAPFEKLKAGGWRLADPVAVSRSLQSYRDFILGSRGEFSVAKKGYVSTRAGWFSDRSAGFLASGRPVIVQDTGFDEWLETDAGVLSFENPEEAEQSLIEADRDYERHCLAAKKIAERYFDSSIVLSRLIERVLCNHEGGSTMEGLSAR